MKDIPDLFEEARYIFDTLDMDAKMELLLEAEDFGFTGEEKDDATLDDVEKVCLDAIAGTLGDLYAQGVGPDERERRARKDDRTEGDGYSFGGGRWSR